MGPGDYQNPLIFVYRSSHWLRLSASLLLFEMDTPGSYTKKVLLLLL